MDDLALEMHYMEHSGGGMAQMRSMLAMFGEGGNSNSSQIKKRCFFCALANPTQLPTFFKNWVKLSGSKDLQTPMSSICQMTDEQIVSLSSVGLLTPLAAFLKSGVPYIPFYASRLLNVLCRYSEVLAIEVNGKDEIPKKLVDNLGGSLTQVEKREAALAISGMAISAFHAKMHENETANPVMNNLIKLGAFKAIFELLKSTTVSRFKTEINGHGHYAVDIISRGNMTAKEILQKADSIVVAILRDIAQALMLTSRTAFPFFESTKLKAKEFLDGIFVVLANTSDVATRSFLLNTLGHIMLLPKAEELTKLLKEDKKKMELVQKLSELQVKGAWDAATELFAPTGWSKNRVWLQKLPLKRCYNHSFLQVFNLDMNDLARAIICIVEGATEQAKLKLHDKHSCGGSGSTPTPVSASQQMDSTMADILNSSSSSSKSLADLLGGSSSSQRESTLPPNNSNSSVTFEEVHEEQAAPPVKVKQCVVCGNVDNLKTCSRCKGVHYCSVACQKQHWPSHKPNCVAQK